MYVVLSHFNSHPMSFISVFVSMFSCSTPTPPQYVDYVKNLRHVQVRGDGSASFEFEMELKDATSRIFLYKVRCRFSQVERTFHLALLNSITLSK